MRHMFDQLLSIFYVIHDMSWNAYDAHNYGLVELINTVMEGAGCFR